MADLNCNTNMLLLVAIVVLFVGYTETILLNFPIIKKLFTDKMNYFLITMLVILILLIDLPCGIILTFLILYLSIYINHLSVKRKVSFSNVENIINQDRNSNLSDSEFVFNNTKPFPNLNLAPFQPDNTINKPSMNSPPSLPISQVLPSKVNDYITTVGPPNREGYDIAGCRYDFKNSPQNFTKFGPPLAQCGAYSAAQVNTTGTRFYPLNA